jgi:surface polysaccharide O-acyltransferase-like enzyme
LRRRDWRFLAHVIVGASSLGMRFCYNTAPISHGRKAVRFSAMTAPVPSTTRNASVDMIRVLAITAVIIIHACPFRDLELERTAKLYNPLGVFLNQLARFGVPFFFVVSGYFWGMKIRGGAPLLGVSSQMAKRILLVLVAWSVVYALPYNVAAVLDHGWLGPFKVWYWHILELARDPLAILFESTSQHLWFLIALLWALLIATAFVFVEQTKGLIAVAIALYVFGILALSYSHTPVGIDFPFYTLEGPFFGTLFFTTGYFLSGYAPSAKWLPLGAALATLGFISHFTEVYLLWQWWDVRPFHHYVFGTYLIGLGVAMVALSNPAALRVGPLARLGGFTLGVYVIHPLFIEWLRPLDRVISGPLWEVGQIILVYAVSVTTVMAMAKNRYLRKLVT